MRVKKLLAFAVSLAVLATTTISVQCVDGLDPAHIIDHYEDYEPIFVHTPVISPVVITDEDGHDIPDGGKGYSELVAENPAAWYQLRLDTKYIMHWDSWKHREILGYGESGESPSKYDKYTQDKWMKLPFEVLYDGVFYELDPSTNYTQWIKIKKPAHWTDTVDNHWIDTPIYIPSYAREMGEVGNEGSIFYKVEAINVDGDLAEHYAEEEAIGNKWFNLVLADDGAKYVATYEIPIQLSGWIYDFTITGTNNGSLYAGESDLGSNELSFVMSKNEKKVGKKNRFGEDNIRYLVDGSLTGTWPEINTITLTDGKSKQFTKQGALWKGQTFSFELKTIANLWNANDKVDIIPTFTYVDNLGNKVDSDHIKVFYHNPDGSGSYIEYGTTRDSISTNWTSTNIGTKMQEGAYYTKDMTDSESGGVARKYHFGDWSTFTAEQYNTKYGLTGVNALTSEKVLGKSGRTYCLSHIILDQHLRLYSGEWEQLSWNTHNTALDFENVSRYSDLDSDGTVDVEWMPEDTERFRTSMQTWYGQFYVPSDLFIVDLNKHPGFDMETYMETANGGLGIKEDDPVFEKSGYIIVNFNIRTFKNGKGHLRYQGGASGGNMWEIEGFNTAPLTGDPTPITSFEKGDVVVIDLEKSVKDKYSPGIFGVN